MQNVLRVNFWKKVLVISGFFLARGVTFGVAEALPGDNLTLFGDTMDNKVDGRCYLRKEYNYFMNQWTTNEVCNPKVSLVESPKVPKAVNQVTNVIDNQYLGYVNTYSVPTYYSGGTANTYRGFYTGNNNTYSYNNWNGYGNAANYLLGSFGGGISSYGYYNNYYPNSVYTYYPSSYSGYYSGYYPDNSSYGYSDWTAQDYEDYAYGFGY
jgi:hypothetical protein